MVPVSWALASADVNAGTASAARIAIIAITTSNSISVNAVKGLVNFIFIFGFSSCGCSEGFGLRGFGFRVVPPSHKAPADKCSGVLGFGCCLIRSQGFGLRMRALIAGLSNRVNNYFLLFRR